MVSLKPLILVSQATLGKAQLQQEKLQNLLDKSQTEVDKLQERLDKSTGEIRRVSSGFAHRGCGMVSGSRHEDYENCSEPDNRSKSGRPLKRG